MYNIARDREYLLVEFVEDFDFPMIYSAIHHTTMLGEYPHTDDIWLIRDKRAQIHLGEIDLLVKEFECRCPRNATRAKTAIVVDEGFTGSVLELLASGLKKKVVFEIGVFRSLEDAECWLEVNEAAEAM